MFEFYYGRYITAVRLVTHEREALEHETFEDSDELPERYQTAARQSPEERNFRKLLTDYRKKNVSELTRHRTMFTTKPAGHWQQHSDERNRPKADLYGPLWRTGELAILVGEPGSGKSILAIQLAESIARGKRRETGDERQETASRNALVSRLRSPVSPAQPVLYFDFQHTAEQFDERYSCASPLLGKLPVRYRFSPKLHRASFGDIEIPEAFDQNFARYFEHSIKVTIEDSPAKVIIIDNLSWLCAGQRGGSAAQARWLRTLKLHTQTTGTSILVLATSKPRRQLSGSPPYEGGVAAALGGRGGSLRPITLNDLVNGPQIADPADSIFAIARSTYAPEIRYVKPLKCAAPLVRTGSESDRIPLQPGEVLTYQLERTAGFTGSTALIPQSEIRNPQSNGPFLGLTYLGPSNESDHLRNYAAEALAQQQAHDRELHRLARRSAKQAIIDGMKDGSYGRYLKGE